MSAAKRVRFALPPSDGEVIAKNIMDNVKILAKEGATVEAWDEKAGSVACLRSEVGFAIDLYCNIHQAEPNNVMMLLNPAMAYDYNMYDSCDNLDKYYDLLSMCPLDFLKFCDRVVLEGGTNNYPVSEMLQNGDIDGLRNYFYQ